jgi:hypothetical protein
VVAGVVVGDDSGIAPQPASTAESTTTTIANGTPRVLIMTPSIAAKKRGRINLRLSGEGSSAPSPN